MSIKNISKQADLLSAEIELYIADLDQAQARAKIKALKTSADIKPTEKNELKKLMIKENSEVKKIIKRINAQFI